MKHDSRLGHLARLPAGDRPRSKRPSATRLISQLRHSHPYLVSVRGPRPWLTFQGDHDAEQCGSNSDCVNRAIFIECLAKECRARGQCRNQRCVSIRSYSPSSSLATRIEYSTVVLMKAFPSGSMRPSISSTPKRKVLV